MERAMSKAERMLQLEQLLLASPEGLRKAEIARRLGVHRATAGRYVEDLTRRVPIWEDEHLLGIDRDDYLTHVRRGGPAPPGSGSAFSILGGSGDRGRASRLCAS